MPVIQYVRAKYRKMVNISLVLRNSTAYNIAPLSTYTHCGTRTVKETLINRHVSTNLLFNRKAQRRRGGGECGGD